MASKNTVLPQKSQWKSKDKIRIPKKLKLTLVGSIVPLVLLVAWQVMSVIGVFESHLLPAPTQVLERIGSLVADGSLWGHIGVTLYRIFIGFGIGVACAVIAGSVVGYLKTAELLVDPLIQGFRSIPSLAWVPLFILWMGIGEPSKITLIAVGVFFPVYLNIVSGIQGVDRKLIEVGKIYNFTPLQMVKRIILPASLPSFFTGVRSGLGLGWMFVVAAELMGASKGIGYLLVVGQNTYSPDLVLASIVMIAIFGKLTDSVLKGFEVRALHWQDNFGKQN
ncbi:ABC transporter permease [Planococcus salinus]|uniref:ABC transporter permease n=1 Tax=Planococcus salinus TaxID=1848460 RepID=A0A3M8PA83_9BACL|nr:ABC transporter permease [Planococcus salinus]RNF40150.1 ABC transporter permease [Planococcus salinus]